MNLQAATLQKRLSFRSTGPLSALKGVYERCCLLQEGREPPWLSLSVFVDCQADETGKMMASGGSRRSNNFGDWDKREKNREQDRMRPGCDK